MRKFRFSMVTLSMVALLIISLGINTMAQTDPAATPNPNEVPLGGAATNPALGSGGPGLDLQISGNSSGSSGGGGEMGEMMGMDKMMMGQMGGMNNQNTMNSAPMNGTTGDSSAILAQLQATNAMILQMITVLSSQQNSSNLQPQLQMLYQMMANQTALIRMLNNASMSMPQNGSSGGVNMGGNSGGGMGMGMM